MRVIVCHTNIYVFLPFSSLRITRTIDQQEIQKESKPNIRADRTPRAEA